MPTILPYGSFVAIRPLMPWWPWVPARVIGFEIDSFGCPWYRVEYAAHAGSYQHTFHEHYIVKVEFEAVEEQKSCGTCAWYYVCNREGAHCMDDSLERWESGEKRPPTPAPEIVRETKTMTVDEAAEMAEKLLVTRVLQSTIPKMKAAGVLAWFDESEDILKSEARERARAIAEALVGVRVTR